MKRHALISLFSALLIVVAGVSAINAQIITTIAGNGVYGYGGDGGLAISAQFALPSGVAVDASGNVYIADRNNSRVRKITAATGIISTFAGTGVFGGALSLGGSALSCSLEYPYGVFASPTGDILITDFYRDMTFNVDHATGNIYSRLGCGEQGNDGDGGPSNMARMMLPRNACMDPAGNTYIADGNWIRKVAAASGIASTVATMPCDGVFFDVTSAGDLYVAGNNMIKKIDLTTGAITTIAGTGVAGYTGNGGPAISATLSNPGNMFIDIHKNLYVCERGNNVVRQINLLTGGIASVAGTGSMGFSGDGGWAPYARLNDPEGVWVDNSGYIYIADAGNSRIRRIVPKSASGGSSASPKDMHGFEAATASNTSTSIFPNPSNGIFTLTTTADQLYSPVKVFNILGQIVYATTVTDTKNVIDLSSQPSGIYTLMMRSDSDTYTQKITKQ